MPKHIALLRGINVGGTNKLPMAELRAICADLGWQNTRTYIASGNVVFDAEGSPDALANQLAKALPIDVPVLVLTASDLADRLKSCPFVPETGNLLHAFFCTAQPSPNLDLIAKLRSSEELEVIGKTFWLHTPDGFSKSKLAERIDRVLQGATYTARNLNTVRKLVDMAAE